MDNKSMGLDGIHLRAQKELVELTVKLLPGRFEPAPMAMVCQVTARQGASKRFAE